MKGFEGENFREFRDYNGIGSPWEQRDVEEMRRLLDRAVSASVNGIVITDPTLPDDPIIYVNDAFETTTGYSREETVGRNCRFLQADDREQEQIDEIRAATKDGRECRVVLRNYRKNGEMFWNELYISPVYGERGELTNFIGVQHDITERKVAEDALSEQEAQWRALIENNPSFILLMDTRGNITYCNPGWIEFLGLEPGEGKDWEDAIHPEDVASFSDGFREAMKAGENYVNPAFRVRRHDGVYRWFSAMTSPVKDDEGEVMSWISVSADIEDRRRGEIALRESEERLRLAINSTGLGTWDFNPVSGELDWDARTKEMFGIPPDFEDVSYEVFQQGVHPLDRERMDLAVADALNPDGRGEIDTEYRTVGIEDGVVRWLRTVGRTFFEEMGTERLAVRFIGTVLDITRSRNAQEERDLLLAREQLARSEAVAARRRLDFLVEADAVLLSSVGYFERLRDTARLTVSGLADWCLVDVLDEDGSLIQVAAAHTNPEKQGDLDLLQRHRSFGGGTSGVAHRVLESGESELIRTVSKDAVPDISSNEEGERILSELGISSLVSVPLLARGRTLGVVTLVSSDASRIYGDEDLALAESLAYRCALAVDNARLYRERSRIARTLQKSLLPNIPEVDKVEVGVVYQSVGEESVIGGDFYDLIETDSGSLVAVVGDVCGKGPAAAAVTALARYTIQAVVVHRDSPSNALEDLNRAMLRQIKDVKFCTVACARLEEAADGEFELSVARGGHPSPLLLRANGRVEKISPPGRVLGIFDDPGLKEWKTRFRPGDAVILYTDGIIEARDASGALFGEERLMELISDSKGMGAKEISERLRDETISFGDGPPRDDIAVLVLKVPDAGRS